MFFKKNNGFDEYKKRMEEELEQKKTAQELERAIATLTKKKEKYAAEAKAALRSCNQSQYMAMVALLKNSIFHLKQAQDMAANYTMAKELSQMQNLNQRFVRSLDSILKKVQNSYKAINLSSTEKSFAKALSQQSETATELQKMLKVNNIMFASSVNEMSDITDDEIKSLLEDEIRADENAMDSSLDDLEKLICGNATPVSSESIDQPIITAVGGPADAPAPTPVPKANPVVEPTAPSVTTPEEPKAAPAPIAEPKREESEKRSPEDELLGDDPTSEDGFIWDNIPTIGFDDIAGLDEVKEAVQIKVLLPLKNPEAFAGYEKKSGGGLCLYGPPGTGKTMIAAAIAKEIGAKFCSVKPSDLLQQGVGNSEKAVRTLFKQARQFPCSVIYFDEMDSISPKSTRSQYAKQLRSEFLSQLQGVESYGQDNGNILFLICSTNKPWDIDSAFLRPGRFGTRIYVGLPDEPARKYMIEKRLNKIKAKGLVTLAEDINVDELADKTNGFNGSDITNLLDRIEEISIVRGIRTGEKFICNDDLIEALGNVHSSVQMEDIVKLKEWRLENDA